MFCRLDFAENFEQWRFQPDFCSPSVEVYHLLEEVEFAKELSAGRMEQTIAAIDVPIASSAEFGSSLKANLEVFVPPCRHFHLDTFLV